MLTVNISDRGKDLILEAEQVEVFPILGTDLPQSVSVQQADGRGVSVSSGVVYVMNSHGATVAKYHIHKNPDIESKSESKSD